MAKENEVYPNRVGNEEIYNLFYEGRYQDVVEATLDQEATTLPASFVPPIVASLTFLGRITEAEIYYEGRVGELTLLEKTMCRFFLGVVNCRHFNFEKARAYFGANYRDARRHLYGTPENDRLLFYLCQGFGFYRYTYGHLRPARRWAKRAYEAAFRVNYLFGRLFSQDLFAHVEINFGKTHAGLKLIEQNIALARSMKRDAVVQMSRVTRVIYRSRFGISGREAVEELLSTLSQITSEDGYSRACLLAELSHQYLIRGNVSQAKETLNSACEFVYRIDNPRLEILLNFRIAMMLYQKGELSQALHLVGSSLKRLHEKVDRHLELKLKGLQYQILEGLEYTEKLPVLAEEIATLTKKTGYFVADRMWRRRQGEYLSSEIRLQDPLGDLHDDIARKTPEVTNEVIESGWLGLLYPICEVEVTTKALLLGLVGKSLTLFDQGNVRHFPRGASNQQAKFLMALADGAKTKEQIIQTVWQEKYQPLRHDPLLYTLVSKLRKELGTHATWVEASPFGYELQPGIVVRELHRSPEPPPAVNTAPAEDVNLNFRQRQILALAREFPYLDVRILGTTFQISAATANRDLVFLEDRGWLVRSGKGRATRYHFQEGATNERN